MTRPALFALAAAALAGLLGCAPTTQTRAPASEPLAGLQNPSLHILTDRGRAAPVTGTFGWGYILFRVAHSPSNQLSAASERLQRSLLAGLSAKGLVYADEQPDLLVSTAVASDAALDAGDLDKAYGELLAKPVEAAEPSLHYKRGVLVLDVVERATGHLLWRGAIQAEFDLAWPEDRKQERCDAIVGALLRHYPEPQ